MAPAQFLCHVAHAPPRPPQGPSGKGVVLTLTALAFVTYLSIFAIRKRSGKDARSWKVFWLDLMKMGIGQGFAWIINVVNSHRNSEMAAGEGESFDAVSWYFPTFMNDELIAVPLGVGLWQLWTRAIRSLAAQGYTAEWIQALAVSGRYHPNQGELTRSQSGRIYLGGKAYDANRRACGCVGAIWNGCCTPLCKAGGCGDADPEVKYDWWFVQLFFWVLCVLLSRILGGLVVPFFHTVMGDNSPCAARARFGGGAMLRRGNSSDCVPALVAGTTNSPRGSTRSTSRCSASPLRACAPSSGGPLPASFASPSTCSSSHSSTFSTSARDARPRRVSRNSHSLSARASFARASRRFKKLVAAKASPRALVQPAGARRSSARLDRVGKTTQLM